MLAMSRKSCKIFILFLYKILKHLIYTNTHIYIYTHIHTYTQIYLLIILHDRKEIS